MALVLNGASGITLPAGAPGVPIIKGGDHDTGFHFPASGEFAISVNGVNKIHFTPTGFIFSGETTLNGLKFPTQTGEHGNYLTANASGEAVWTSPQFLAISGGTLTGAITFSSGQTFPALPYLPVTGGTLSGAVTFASGQTFTFASGQTFPVLPYVPTSGIGVTVQAYDANTAKLNVVQTFTSAQTFSGGANDNKGNLRNIPQNTQTNSYTLLASDAGKHISITTGGITVPSGVFAVGEAVTIYNNSSSSQTITQGNSVTLRNAGTTNTGNRTLAAYGLVTILCVDTNVFVITGGGLS